MNPARPDQPHQDHPGAKTVTMSGRRVIQAVIFGLAFGFLLQKGGVAKYHVLIGALLLEDFTVFKVMLSAIVVGMAGFFVLHRLNKVELQIKPTRYAAIILGGLIFGAGFALSGYCPGTGAAALGQNNWDALFPVLGMMAGSYLFAEISLWFSRTMAGWGDRGKVLLPEALRIPRPLFLIGFILLLVGSLVALGRFT
jgi:uncharacterized protein